MFGRRAVLSALVLAILLTATPAFALYPQFARYYSDATFTTVVGAHFHASYPCPYEHWAWGNINSNYVKIEEWDTCDEEGSKTVECWAYENGAWVQVTCP